MLEAEHQENELRRKFRVSVGLYKRLNEGGLLKKVTRMDLRCKNKTFLRNQGTLG